MSEKVKRVPKVRYEYRETESVTERNELMKQGWEFWGDISGPDYRVYVMRGMFVRKNVKPQGEQP